VDVRVLGELEVRSGGRPLPLGTPKQRTVLALLLARTGQFVPVDELVDEVWSAEPPASAGANVRTYAANLRRLLTARGDGRIELVRRGAGYVLRLIDAELDAYRFSQLIGYGRTAAAQGEPEPAVRRFEEAAALWRGRALEDVPLGWRLSAWRAALEEERIGAVEERGEAYLSLGRLRETVTMLRGHLAAYPTREPGYATLMLALYRSGDVTGALDAFVDARSTLAEQLGIEPGEQLQRLHRAVLNRDPRLRRPAAPVPVAAARPVPRELPPDSPAFTGRKTELGRIRALLGAPVASSARGRVVAVHGRGGVGKSALAARAAHAVAAGFPDGQLYVDLHGSTPGVRPRTAHEVLDRCLRALGVPAAEVPPDESDAAARWRTLTAGRRILLLLDNATDAAQVLPVLPASGGCAAIVTSRRLLSTVDADGYLELSGLPEAAAVELLRRSARRADLAPGDGAAIAALCEYLPLALRIAGARLAARPELSGADLAARLRDERGRLDELGMDRYAVRGSIRVGYDGLRGSEDPVDRAASRVFPLLGLLPVPRLHPATVAALLGAPGVPAATRALDRLVDVRLLEEAPAGRYRLHDLVRLVAGECAIEVLGAAERDAAVRRALDHHLASAMRADAVLRPGRGIIGFDHTPAPDLPTAPIGAPAQAVAWLEAELPGLLAAAEYAATRSDDAALFGLRLARVLQWWLGKRADWPTELAVARVGELAADRAGDAHHRAIAATLVGRAQLHLGRRAQAAARLEQALTAFRGLGDHHQVMSLVCDLGQVARLAGDHQRALEHFAEALFICRSSPTGVSEGVVLANLADVYIDLRHWEEALGCLRESIAIRRERRDTAGETVVLPRLGYLCCQLGRLAEAVGHLDDAVRRCAAIDNQVDLWYALIVRAEAHLRLGRRRAALADARRALTVCRDTAWEYETAASLRQVARALLALGRPGPATEFQDRAAVAFAALTGRRDPALEDLLAGSPGGPVTDGDLAGVPRPAPVAPGAA
jgi:DNA-binding SARP family transcriptional activator